MAQDNLNAYAQWLVQNKDKKGTPEFNKVAQAFQMLQAAGPRQSEAPANPEGTGVGRAFQRGVIGTKQGIQAGIATNAANTLESMDVDRLTTIKRALGIAMPKGTYAMLEQEGFDGLDRVTSEEDLSKWFDSLGTNYNLGPQNIAQIKAMVGSAEAAKSDYRAPGGKFDTVRQTGQDALTRASELEADRAALPMSPTAQRGAQDFQDAEGVMDWARKSFKDPMAALAFIGETAAETGPAMAAGIGTSVVTGNPLLGAGIMIAASTPREYGGEVMSFLRDQDIDVSDPQAIREAIDNGNIMAEAQKRGLTKAAIISAFEAIGMKGGGGILLQGGKQAFTGGAGEAASQVALDGEITSAKEVALEAVAELATTPGEAAILYTKNGTLKDPRSLSDTEAQAAASLANRIRTIANQNGYNLKDVGSTGDAKQALEAAHEQISGQIKEIVANPAVKKYLNPKQAKTLDQLIDDYAAAQVAIRQGKNKVKSKVTQENFDAIMRLLPPTVEAQQIANLMREGNQLTDLFKNGTKGGVSQFTDTFNPFTREDGSYDPSKVISGMANKGVAIATMGGSLPYQFGAVGAGRAIDAVTGRRSAVNRFVNKFENKETLPDPVGPSLIAAERLKQEQDDARAAELGQLPQVDKDNSPIGTILSGTGLDRDGLKTAMDEIQVVFPDVKALEDVFGDIRKNLDGGTNRIRNLNDIIPVINQHLNTPDTTVQRAAAPDQLLAQRGGVNIPNIDQTPAQNTPTPDVMSQAPQFGPQFTTQENYNRGIEANIAMNRELVEGVTTDPKLNRVQKGRLITSLDVLANNLGSDPVAAAQEQVQKLEEAGVPQEAIDAYVKPYVDRVVRQQAARVSPDEPILGSINPDIPAPTTVQTAALSAPTPVVYQQIDAPEGVTKHGLLPHLRSETESFRDGKPLFVLKTTNNNAQRQIEAIDEVLSRHPDPASSSEAWGAMLGDAYASRDIPVQPYGFIEDLNNGGAQELLSTLTPGQIADADHGFRNAAEFRQAYTNGEIAVEDTGRLFLWSFLSKGVSPYNQEGLFIDAFGGIDQWINQAADGNLNLDDYKRWAATTAPRGSGKPGAGAIHNLNAFGKDFLLKMSQDAGKGDGRSRLQVIHDMMSDPNTTGKEVRREFLRMGEGVGIDNKVVSFTLLVAGYDDVLVLDRVQMRQMWNDGRFSGINLYDGYKHNGDTVNGSGMALTTTGARGLLVYEAMEKSLQNRLQQIYSDIGRPNAASVGRYHWETWVASSQQEASHGTIDAILRRAKGDPNPLDGVTAKEGEYGAFAYGARYGIENGVPMFTYGVPERGEYKFTVPEFQSFLNDIKRKAKSNKVIPYGFGVQESGNAPWYTREGVNLDALAEKAKEYGTQVRTTDAELREGQAIPDGRTSDASVGETAILSRATKRPGSSDDIRADEQGQSGRSEGVGVPALQGAAGDPQVVTSLDGLNDPDTLDDFLARPGWAIITATNEKLPDSIRDTRNAESNAYLERQLNEQGIPYVNISGTYQGIDQGPSFLILADEETAMKLGKFHLQESILTNQGLVYTRRPAANTPATQQNMFGPQAQQQDFYSTVSGLPFSMGLDFSKGPGKQFYKPGYSEAPNRPQLPIREKDGMVELHHWSNKRRKTIDPHFAGSGPLNGVERKRGAKISFFGIAPRQSLRDPGTGYVKETGLGSYEHIVLIDPKDLYPVFQDPDGLLQDVGSNWSKAEDIIRDAGYKGYYTTDDGSGSAPLGNVATLFEPIKVTEVRGDPALSRGTEGPTSSGEPILGSRSPIESILRDTSPGANPDGPRPDVIPAEKPQVTPEQYKKAVVEFIRPQFQIGLKGSELEDGISNFNDAVEFAKKLGIVVRLAMSQNELNTLLTLDTGQDPAKMGTFRGMFQRKGPKKKGKGTEGTIWAMKPGADKGDGTYVTDIEALTTLLHEISHAITLGPLDGKADQEVYSYFINRKQSSKPGTGIVGRSDFTPPGSFVDSAIKPLLDADWEQMSPTQKKAYAEIVDLQENVEAYSPKNPGERRAVRFIRQVMSNPGYSQETKQAYQDYTRMAAEFAVDPVWVYLINPKLAKKLMPVTSKMIQQEFRKADNKVIQFYAHPLAVVMAALVALEMAMDDEEERKQQQMPPGALNQPMMPGALSA